MKKRLGLLLVTVFVLVGILTVGAFATDVSSGTCGDNLTWTLDESGTLTISGTGAMENYYYDTPWGTDIKAVIIQSGVTSIGDCAFYTCSSLTSVEVPDSVTEISDSAFSGCSKLADADGFVIVNGILYDYFGGEASVTIPNGIKRIGEGAFAFSSSLTAVSIPDSVTSIGRFAFFDCNSLTSVNIPDSVASINYAAFDSCASLTSVDIPSSVESIGYCAFIGSGLTSVNIAEGVNEIKEGAFLYCSSLSDVTIPESVEYISGRAFLGTPWIESFGDFVVVNNILVNYLGDETEVEIPSTVTHISEFAFCFNDMHQTLTDSVTIPASVTLIDSHGLWYCNNVIFKGNAPALRQGYMLGGYENTNATNLFWKYVEGVTVYYPEGNATWTDEIKQLYTGENPISDGITWVPYTLEPCAHTWNAGVVTTPATATTDGVKTFTCTICGETKTEAIPAEGSPFSDVQNTKDYFYEPVLWAVNQGITSGTSTTTFSPNQTCTRGQVVTFLWRAAGKPTVGGSNPFVDVKKSDYFYDAVLWAVSKGITNGTDKTHFSPNAKCTRGQVVTFMYRAADKPAVSGASNPFTDVKKSDYFYDAVLWAVEKGITKGTSTTSFSPNVVCTRGQVVTFLYRDLG